MIIDDTVFADANHIYRITREINLDGKTIDLPSNCVLDFTGGGSITNGTINFNNTTVWPNGCVIEDYISATITGTYKQGQLRFDTSAGLCWWSGSEWIYCSAT